MKRHASYIIRSVLRKQIHNSPSFRRGTWTLLLLLCTLLAACPGPDFAPVYFGEAESGRPTPAAPSTSQSPAAQTCTIQFHAELCIALKSERLSVGNVSEGEEALCTSVPAPIPLLLEGEQLEIHGAQFPDIALEGHGLPFPVTVNGRGDDGGLGNIGVGTLDDSGTIQVDGFDLYVHGAETTGRIPDLQFTTGTAAAIRHMHAFQGFPLDDAGNMALVTSTRLSSLFPSTEHSLQDTGLMLRLAGRISPTRNECLNTVNQPQQWRIHKIITQANGEEVDIAIPGGNRLEISAGTYIGSAAHHIGARYESEARFRLHNISERDVQVRIPPRVSAESGPFTIRAASGLNQTVPADGSVVITVQFTPRKVKDIEPGLIERELAIGSDSFTLVGTALDDAGRLRADHVQPSGAALRTQVTQLDLGNIAVLASPQHDYFSCTLQQCGSVQLPSDCQTCGAEATHACLLLPTDASGQPVDEVSRDCQVLRPHAEPLQHLDFGNAEHSDAQPRSAMVRLRNIGTQPITIEDIALVYDESNQSPDEFVFSTASLAVSTALSDIQTTLQSTSLPVELPAFSEPGSTRQAYITVSYAPKDLRGADGKHAGVGSTIVDRATLRVTSAHGPLDIALQGQTAIKDVPPLQLHFGTDTGLHNRGDGADFAFRGITEERINVAVPVFASAQQGATQNVRIVSFRIDGPDADAFAFFDSQEEILTTPEAERCTIPVYDANGAVVDYQSELDPTSLVPNGFDLAQDGSTPFFGCVNFLRPESRPEQRSFRAMLHVETQEINAQGEAVRNPDGSVKTSQISIPLVAVVNPKHGPFVFRVSQTMSAIMNQNFPSIAAVPAGVEVDAQIAAGQATENDRFLFLGALLADPFDEAILKNEHGEVVSRAGDNITGIFRPIDTRPSSATYDNPRLGDYATLLHDQTAPEGQRGIFFDYPNVPSDFQTSALRIFTASLSYPGPNAAPEDVPESPSLCEVVNPCSPAGQRKFGDGPTEPGKLGVCAYFYTTAGAYDSPTMHYAEDSTGGTRKDLCEEPTTPQQLYDITGQFSLDGNLSFDAGLRFWGPTYFHNPNDNAVLGPTPVLDEVWHFNLTTQVLAPPAHPDDINLLPSDRLVLSKEEYKIDLDNPLLCNGNTDNQRFGNKTYSTWEYFAPLMSKDPEGKIPARCGDGGKAYFHGRPYDPETGVMTVVAASKFSSNDDLTFAFTDVPIFIVMNGWLCDPNGDPEQFEGAECFSLIQNERDRTSQISIMGGDS